MPAEFLIDAEHRAVFTLASGTLTVLDLLDHMSRLQADPLFSPSFCQIADFRRVQSQEVSSADIRSLGKRTVFDPASRRALIVGEAPSSGPAFQFAADREKDGEPNIRAVRTLEDAVEWTGIDLDAAERAFLQLATRPKAR